MLRDKVFMTTVSVSIIVHLSMITLFSIYVLIPVKRPVYYEFDIVDPVTHESVIRRPLESLKMPSFDELVDSRAADAQSFVPDQTLTLDAPLALTTTLPEISLPSLDIAQMERSEMIGSSLRIRSEFTLQEPQDAWGRLLSGIGRLDDRLRDLSPFEFGDAETPVETLPTQIESPADGIAMYVEWVGEPRDRGLLFAAPIVSIWQLNPESMREPITLPFKVNTAGKVVLVLAPPTDEGEVINDIAHALELFQFAPLTGDTQREQYGTLVITPEDAS